MKRGLLLQYTTHQLGSVYTNLVEIIAAIISTEDSSIAAVEGLLSSSTIQLTTTSGCARDDDGSLRVQFYASAENITREIDGLLASRRRLQSTPCSSTDGTSVGFLAHKHHMFVLCFYTCVSSSICISTTSCCATLLLCGCPAALAVI